MTPTLVRLVACGLIASAVLVAAAPLNDVQHEVVLYSRHHLPPIDVTQDVEDIYKVNPKRQVQQQDQVVLSQRGFRVPDEDGGDTMLEPILLLPFLPGVHGNGTASQDSLLYQQFLSGEHGMVEGIPNLALAAMIVGPLVLLLVVSCLVKRYKEKKNQVKEIAELPSPRGQEEAKPKGKGDIFQEIEGELERHEEQRKKLGAYLKFLSTRDGGNIARTNAKRVKKGSDDEDNDDDENEEERIERIEMQRQQLSQQLKTMLQSNNNQAKAALQRQRPVVLD